MAKQLFRWKAKAIERSKEKQKKIFAFLTKQ